MSERVLPVCYCTAYDDAHVHLPAMVDSQYGLPVVLAPSVEEGPRPDCKAAGAPSVPGTCFKCGVRVEPSPCFCGGSHTGTYCWSCHHKNVSSCAAPHCPEHGAAAAQAWLDGQDPAPSSEAPARCPEPPYCDRCNSSGVTGCNCSGGTGTKETK